MYEYMFCKGNRLSELLRGMMFEPLAIEPQIFSSSIALCGNIPVRCILRISLLACAVSFCLFFVAERCSVLLQKTPPPSPLSCIKGHSICIQRLTCPAQKEFEALRTCLGHAIQDGCSLGDWAPLSFDA